MTSATIKSGANITAILALFITMWVIAINPIVVTGVLALGVVTGLAVGGMPGEAASVVLAVFIAVYLIMFAILDLPHLVRRLAGFNKMPTGPLASRPARVVFVGRGFTAVGDAGVALLKAGMPIVVTSSNGTFEVTLRDGETGSLDPQIMVVPWAGLRAGLLQSRLTKVGSSDLVVTEDAAGPRDILLTDWQGCSHAEHRHAVEISIGLGKDRRLVARAAEVAHESLSFPPRIGWFDVDDGGDVALLPAGNPGFGFQTVRRRYGVAPDVMGMLRTLGCLPR
jgi:hypothetical protein